MINVIGLGYIGLPTALMFAKSGQQIVGTDYNKDLVSKLQNGELTFEEKGLEDLFASALQNNIEFTNEYISTDKYIITVPTPYDKETKKLNQEYLINAINSVLDVCAKESIVVIESTVSPGSIDKHIRPEILKRGLEIGTDIHLVHAPERIIPGNMIYELEHNSRTIGADNKVIGEKVKDWYSKFCKSEIVVTDIKSAEMSKVVENTFRDINIAFANELAKLCHEDGMDVYEIINIANKHPRVNILQPGPGVGGHCIPVDPWFLVGDYPDSTDLIRTAREVNSSMPKYVLTRIKEIMKEHNISDFSEVGLYGLTYKENIDDVRESPTLQLLDVIKEETIEKVKVYDPYVNVKITDNQYFKFEDFTKNTKIIVLMVAHDEIKNNIKNLNDKIVLDTKNSLNDQNSYKL